MDHLQVLIDQQKSGRPAGLPSICSANPAVLDACLHSSERFNLPILIEATCNQVNQDGGYTGLTPVGFMRFVDQFARRYHIPAGKLILGGDHLGPSPWQNLPAETAMQKAEVMVRQFAEAGFKKFHLDASMKLGDDDPTRPLPPEISAARSARLAAAVETALPAGAKPHYVIGTEVPVPGGAKQHEDGVQVTQPEDVLQTIELTRQAFIQNHLADAWERVMAVVVQPGVEFGDDFVLDFDPRQAGGLSRFIESQPNLVYEAHSTDYQTPASLKALVNGHFAILKVGPELTYAFREALFALAQAEKEWIPEGEQSHLVETIESIMTTDPIHWQKYYHGTGSEQAFARKFSLSDRIRYYWPNPTIQTSIRALMHNLEARPLPYALLSQYLPLEYEQLRREEIRNTPEELIRAHIKQVVHKYVRVCIP
jgi:D-tagatose-1,6-bisphosphate aldolase subunit GatZ/KbaZ